MAGWTAGAAEAACSSNSEADWGCFQGLVRKRKLLGGLDCSRMIHFTVAREPGGGKSSFCCFFVVPSFFALCCYFAGEYSSDVNPNIFVTVLMARASIGPFFC